MSEQEQATAVFTQQPLEPYHISAHMILSYRSYAWAIKRAFMGPDHSGSSDPGSMCRGSQQLEVFCFCQFNTRSVSWREDVLHLRNVLSSHWSDFIDFHFTVFLFAGIALNWAMPSRERDSKHAPSLQGLSQLRQPNQVRLIRFG